MEEFESVELLSLEYTVIPNLGTSGWLKTEVVKGRTRVDGIDDRGMIYHRFSHSDSVSGVFEILFEQPFGLGMVSGV
jgi:hypothetical protein